MAVERALNMILYPQLMKELKNKLVDESKEHVLKVRTEYFNYSYQDIGTFMICFTF